MISQDILELSFEPPNRLTIKLIQFYPRANIISHSIFLNSSLFDEIIKVIDSVGYSKESFSDSLINLGVNIYKLIFFDSSKGKLLEGMDSIFENNTFLTLFFKGEIENIPIELAYNGAKFLGLSRPSGRSIPNKTYHKFSEGSKKVKESAIIIADPTSCSRMCYDEGIAVYDWLNKQNSSFFNRVDFLSKELTKIEIMDIFESYTLIHFAGQGEFTNDKGSGLLIGDKLLFTELDITSLSNPPNFIFINACLTSKISYVSHSSLIKKLLRLGVGNIIASSWNIIDESYISFILLFYNELFSGRSVGESLVIAKSDNFSKGDYKWSYFTLYGNPTDIIYS